MRVTFHGVRGSVPTPGPRTARYGGNTVCVELRTGDDELLILDAGTGMRGLGQRLVAEDFKKPIHVLITHRHWDHILGLPFFAPLFRKDAHVIVHPFTTAGWFAAEHPVLFDGVHFPVRWEDIPARVEVSSVIENVRIGSARVSHIALNHPGGAVGFRIEDDDKSSVCYLTDNELDPPGTLTTTPADLARFAHGTGLLIHDAQYLPTDMPEKKGWGHSLVGEVLALAKDAEARAVALHHHEPERDDDALDKIGVDAEKWAHENARGLETMVASEGLELTPAK